MLHQAYGKVKIGTQIRRTCNVSNAVTPASLVATVGGTPIVLPLVGDGAVNRAFNNPTGYASVDLANDWFDIRNLHISADLLFRVTLSNGAGGGSPVSGANIVLRFFPDLSNPGVFIDNPNADITFRGQSMMLVTGFTDGAQGVQVCVRTTSNESVRCHGIYLSVDDIYPILGGL